MERSGKKIHLQTQYRLIGGGVSIVEDWIEDGEEMITVYHNKNGQLNAVHYCALGNAPTLALSSMDSDSLTFTFDPICGLNPKKERFVTRMLYRFKGGNPTEMYSEGVSDGISVDGEEGEVIGKVTLTKVDEWSMDHSSTLVKVTLPITSPSSPSTLIPSDTPSLYISVGFPPLNR